MEIRPVGVVKMEEGRSLLQIKPAYRAALKELEGFSHINVIWWGDRVDTAEQRRITTVKEPYVGGPAEIGIFATRSEVRPNPILISPVPLLSVDMEQGIIEVPWIDAEPESPILDIKPYMPSIDRVREIGMPVWCAGWPQWYEDSAEFDWGGVFNF